MKSTGSRYSSSVRWRLRSWGPITSKLAREMPCSCWGGNIGGEAHHLLIKNASVIEIGLDDDVWKSTSFALSYSDSESDAWTLSVAGAHWVVP